MKFYNQVCTDLTDTVWDRVLAAAGEKNVGAVLKLHRRLVPNVQTMRQQLTTSIRGFRWTTKTMTYGGAQ